METGYWVIRRYYAGLIGEAIKYWISAKAPTRSPRRLKADVRKVEANARAVERTVARLIHANFQSGRDILLGLDYDKAGLATLQGDPLEAAQGQLRLFLRRVRRRCAAAGVEFRYIALTSDMDGRTGAAARIHHHLIVNVEALAACQEKWRLGGVNWKILCDQADQSELAAYLIRQVRRQPDLSKYIPSKNLRRPKPVDRIARGGELRLPQGAALLYRGPYQPGQTQYMRYLLPSAADSVETRAKRKERECERKNQLSAGRGGTGGGLGAGNPEGGAPGTGTRRRRQGALCTHVFDG